MHSKSGKIFAVIWIISVLALGVTLTALVSKSRLNNSIMALLPNSGQKGVSTELLNQFNQKLDRQLVWLISAPIVDQEAVFSTWTEKLNAIPLLHNIAGKVDDTYQKSWGEFVSKHRAALMDSQTKTRLQNQTQTPWILSQLYSPFAGVSAKEIASDPLLLTRGIILDQQKHSGVLQVNNGWLTAKDEDNQPWAFIRAELKASSYDVKMARQTVESIEQAKISLIKQYPDVQILQRGTLFYSHYASELAQKDIKTIGVVSTIGIILLIWFIFRSMRPLWLTLLSLCVGLLGGITAVLLVFGEIHIITLVMSTSIVGVSIDYALLYLTERMINGTYENARTTLKKIFTPLFGALFSTALAYFLLFFTPFIGLQQLSIFAVFGLIGAFLTVACWFPYLANNMPARNPKKTIILIKKWLHLWQTNRLFTYGLPITILLLAIFGLSQLTIDDDIGKLQALPKHLRAQEEKIAHITGQRSDQKWLVVAASSAEKTLQKLEEITPLLSKAEDDGLLKKARILPLPSLATQQKNIELVLQETPKGIALLKAEGLEINDEKNSEIKLPSLTIDEWINSPISDGWRLLWSGLPNGNSAALIPLDAIANEAGLLKLIENVPDLYWIDRKTEISELFATYRNYMGWMLALALFLISGLFIWRLKLNHGIRCIIPMILSVSGGIAALGILGISLNLFSLMAVILVLGVGIDYTFFFSNKKGTADVAMLTVFAAAFIAELTFGLLAFSHTEAISGFGIVLSVGIFIAFLLSPLAVPDTKCSLEDL